MWARHDREARPREARLQRTVAGLIRRQADFVGDRVRHRPPPQKALGAAVKSAESDWLDWVIGDQDEETQRWTALVLPQLSSALEAGGARLLSEVAGGIDFDITDPRVRQWLRQREQVIKTIVGNREAELRASLSAGYEAGETVPDLMKRVAEYGTSADYKAERIARTEVIGAMNAGALRGMQQVGIEYKQWVAVRDNRTRDSHAAVDGTTIPVDKDFHLEGGSGPAPGDIDDAAEVINCFPGDARVVPLGRVLAVTRRTYQGPLCEIVTSSGQLLAGTPNHPVLTPEGWIALGALKQGDDVVGRCGQQDLAEADPDPYGQPLALRQLFELAAVGRLAVRLAGREPQFHGDGRQGQVYVVPTYGQLRDRRQAAVTKPASEGFFALTDTQSTVLGNTRAQFQLRRRTRLAPERGVGKSCQSLALFGGRMRHAGMHALAAVARRNAMFQQNTANNAARMADPGSECFLGDAGKVVCDKVVNVRRYEWAGHVYNLQTSSGRYICNGIIAHNCRCALAAVEGPGGEGD